MEPVAIVHSFLRGLELREVRGGPYVFQVPLRWQRPLKRTHPVVRFSEARRQGTIEPGPASLWLNRGPDLILALPGEEVRAGDRRGRACGRTEGHRG